MPLVSRVREWALETDCLRAKSGSAIYLLCDVGKSLAQPLLSHVKTGQLLSLYLEYRFRGWSESDPSFPGTFSLFLARGPSVVSLTVCMYAFSPFYLHFSLPSFPEQPRGRV